MNRVGAGPGRDSSRLELVHQFVALDGSRFAHPAHERLPCVAAVLGLVRRFQPIEAGKSVAIPSGPLGALVDEAIQLAELDDTDGCLEVRHPIVEAEFLEAGQDVGAGPMVADLFWDGCSVVAHAVDRFGHGSIVGGDHASLPGRDRLAGMKREAAEIAQRPGRFSPVGASGCTCGILDERNPRGSVPDRGHVGAQSEEVNRHHCLGSSGDCGRHRVCANIERCWVDVDQYRRRSAIEDGVGGRDPSEGGDDYFVTRADSERQQS